MTQVKRRKGYSTGAQKWHIVSLLGDVTSPTTVADYVSMTCSEHRDALTAAPIADGVHLQQGRWISAGGLECPRIEESLL